MDLSPGCDCFRQPYYQKLRYILSFWNRFTEMTVYTEDDGNKMDSIFWKKIKLAA